MVLEATFGALWGRGAGCLSGVGTYLPGTVGQAVKAVSEPTSRALLGQGCRLFDRVGTYLLSTAGQGCRVFKWCQFLLHQQVRGAELDTVPLLF